MGRSRITAIVETLTEAKKLKKRFHGDKVYTSYYRNPAYGDEVLRRCFVSYGVAGFGTYNVTFKFTSGTVREEILDSIADAIKVYERTTA